MSLFMNTFKKISLFFSISIILSSCLALAIGGGAIVATNTIKEKSYGQSLDDATIKTKITTELVNKMGKYFDIYLDVNEGNVLITGAVISAEDSANAENIIKNTPNVQRIFNRLEIGKSRSIGQKTSDKLTSANISRKFLFDESVDYINEYITVYNNKVYIMGIARSEAELNKIIGIAKAEDGVEKVETFVRIESGYVKPKVNNKVNKGE